ncbi:MAG: hypothetical protein ACO3NK_09360 [Prochlorotrichaceae cyanobacterium]
MGFVLGETGDVRIQTPRQILEPNDRWQWDEVTLSVRVKAFRLNLEPVF